MGDFVLKMVGDEVACATIDIKADSLEKAREQGREIVYGELEKVRHLTHKVHGIAFSTDLKKVKKASSSNLN